MNKAVRLSGKEIQKKLLELGIVANISNVRIEYQEEILKAVEIFREKFPELAKEGIVIREAYLWELKPNGQTIKSWVSSTHHERQHGKLIVVVLINPIWFRTKNLNKYLKMKFESGYSTCFNVTGMICHELGHVLWMQLVSYSLFQKFNNFITKKCFDEFESELVNERFINDILHNACLSLNERYNPSTFKTFLSDYSIQNARETFAEAIAFYCTSVETNNLVEKIIYEYRLQFKQCCKNITN